MANRTTGELYTGINSVSFQKSQEKKRVAESAKIAQQAELKPFAEDILKLADEVRKEIALELANLITVDTDKEDVKSVLIGLRLADSKFVSFKARLNNILRRQVKASLEVEDEL